MITKFSSRLYQSLFLVFSFLILTPGSIYAVSTPCVNNCPGLSPGTTSGEWPMAGANLQRTSWNTESVRGQLTVDWYTSINNIQGGTGNEVKMLSSEPIAANGKIFTSNSVGLFAFNSDTGALLWSYGTNIPFNGSPTYANGLVYVAGYDRRVYAINASDGKLKTGWAFTEAGAGYDTNPLIVNNRIYIGNRDGYMYCLDANTGSLIWKWRDENDIYPDAPIRFSAAYKDGVLYWGQDNARAYAIRDSGNSASLVWKSAKLPGVGFTSYWTVLYHDKNLNKDYVILSGSKKSNTNGWFGEDYYYKENYDVFGSVANGTYVGALGNVPGDWASGTQTVDVSKIQNYFTANPHKRHLFVLDIATGNEFTPYAPVNWVSTTHGGDKRPPLVNGIDGVIYSHIGYQFGPDANTYPNMGASGCFSGWKFGTQYISRACTMSRGFADETVHFTGGGEKVYWSEGFNMGYGSFDITKPVGSNNQVEYAACGCMWGCLGIPGASCGGGTSSMIPYKDRLYMIEGKTLMALKLNGAAKSNSSVTVSTPTNTQPNVVQSQVLLQKLETEIGKIVSTAPLRPGFMDSGFWGAAFNLGFGGSDAYAGDHLTDYFHTPTDTIDTLFRAYPLLSQSLKDQTVTYLKNYFGVGKINDVTKFSHIGWKNGGNREIFDDTPEMQAVTQRNSDDVNSHIASVPRASSYNPDPGWPKIYTFTQDAFYGAWKYAQLVPAEKQAIWDSIKNKLETPPLDDMLIKNPHVLNQYINGYMGYVELGKLVGANTSSQTTTLNRLIDLRINNFTTNSPYSSDQYMYSRNLDEARNFMYLTPELADIFKARIPQQIQTAINTFSASKPLWFVTKFDQTAGEGVFEPLYTYNALFQARAQILAQPYSELAKYVDVPAFWRGDLFYIQNLTAALKMSGPVPTGTPLLGDINNDGIVNILDYTLLSNAFGTNNSASDLNKDGTVNILDYTLLSNNFGK